MTALWVLPTINAQRGDRCLGSLKVDHVLRVNNRVHNRGVSAAWNVGRALVIDTAPRFDYLVVVSEAVEFGEAGGVDFEAQLGGPWCDAAGSGWHLVAFSAALLDVVGPFDEWAFPAYFEDTDYLYRMHLAGFPSPRENDLPHHHRLLHVAMHDHGSGLNVSEGHVTPDWPTLEARYIAKWGGPQGHEVYKHPYDKPEHGWWGCPDPAAA